MRKVGIVLIAIIIFLLAGPVILGFNVQRAVLSSPDNIKLILSKISAYDRLTKIKAADLTTLIQPEDRDTESQIPTEMIQKAIDSITPQTAQKVVEQSLTAYYASMQGKSSGFDIDLREIKQSTLAAQPPDIQAEFSKSVPDFYTVNMPAKSQSVFRVIMSSTMKYLGFGILIFLALIAILMGSGAKGKVATLGTISLVIAIPLITIYGLSFLIPFGLIATNGANSVSATAISVLQDFAKELCRMIMLNIRNQGLVALGIAILAFIIAAIIPGKKVAVAAPAAPAAPIPATPVAVTPPIIPVVPAAPATPTAPVPAPTPAAPAPIPQAQAPAAPTPPGAPLPLPPATPPTPPPAPLITPANPAPAPKSSHKKTNHNK